MTGKSDKLDAFLAAIDTNSIIEVVRSGATGISWRKRFTPLNE